MFYVSMNTTNVSSTSFSAKFINYVPVKKLDFINKTYTESSSSLVQIDPKNVMDLLALQDTTRYWHNARYADNIFYTARNLFNCEVSENRYQIYALTTQKEDFEELSPNSILGLVEVKNKPKTMEILHLQVDPELVFANSFPNYKYVGTGILNSLKKLYNKTIELESACTAVEFYLKNGFKMQNPNKLRLFWEVKK